ncbi:MAG: DUF4430 domain-containing protein [Clostridia bacterium]|nr:DUF4430 domain-containing protein [Clostridia bacterium]
MRKLRWIGLLVLIAVCFSAFSVSAGAEIGEAEAALLSYAVREAGATDVQDFIDRCLPERIGIDAEWYVLALAREGNYDFSAYAKALVAYVNEHTVTNAVTRQKYALALLASGYTADFVRQTADECAGKLGIMSLVWALHLAENGWVPADMTAAQIVDRLLSAELENGGFAITGTNISVDATAMVLQALAPYASDEAVGAVIERGLTRLSAEQTANGGFVSYGEENAESCAQVLIMMACLKLPPDDPRFVKNGNGVLDALLSYRDPDGGFSHIAGGEVGESATAQAYLALASLSGGSLYRLEGQDALQRLEYEAPAEESVSWRLYACLAVGAAAALAALILFLRGNRRVGNYLMIALAGAVLCLLFFVLKIESPDGFYGGADAPKDNIIGTVTLEIRCDVIAGRENVPADGVILAETSFALAQGETVFDILDEAARKYRIHTEHDGSGKLAYIRGIAYLYELQHGDLSGWIYRVNGESPSVGCGAYTLSDGDRIVWHYSLEQGADIP